VVTKAVSGLNVDKARVKVYTEQGDDWFRAITTRTDREGVIEIKDVLPGWYRLEVDEDSEEPSQYLGVRLRMLDNDGKRLDKKENLTLSVKLNGEKVQIGKVETDNSGWLEVSGLLSGYKYKLELEEKGNASLSGKDGSPRVKVRAKVRESDWFNCFYERTNDAKVLEVRDVLPGQYQFSYKTGDRDSNLPFILKARFRDEDGDRLKEPTPIKLSFYKGHGSSEVRVPIGTVLTDHRGVATIPNVLTEVNYKVEVLSN
jgi:hypothetical protein